MKANFEYTTNLQYSNLHLRALVSAFESGEKFVTMSETFAKQLKIKDCTIKSLKLELKKAHIETVRVRNNWFQTFEDMEKERLREQAVAKSTILALDMQILQLMEKLTETKNKLHCKNIEVYEVATLLEDEKGKNQKLTSQINRDYENSSIPSSQKTNRKKITNSREKTEKKPGAQHGHEGHKRKAYTPTNRIQISPLPEYAESDDYKATGKIISKQVVNISIKLIVDEYTTPEYRNIHTGQRVHAPFPEGIVNEQSYGGTIKALAYLLKDHYHLSIDKTCDFLSEITDGALSISHGTVSDLSRVFSEKTQTEQKEAFADLLTAPVMNADFTSVPMNGKRIQILVCADATTGTALYFAKEHKGHEGVKETPIEDYQGIIVQDHDTTFYKYGSNHQECLAHILRYLKDSMENESHLTWNQKMRTHLQHMIHARKEADLTEEQVVAFETVYDEILESAKVEYEYEPPTTYYRDGYNLYKRMDKYKDYHLLFLHDKRVPTTNNLAERLLRVLKRKSRQVMTFRSFDSISYLCNGMGMLSLLRAKNDSLYQSVSEIFEKH